MAQSAYIDSLKTHHRLSDTEIIELEGEPNQVFLTLQEIEVATFEGSSPMDTFASITARTNKGFFRIRKSPRSDLIQYAGINDILAKPHFQTPEVKQLINFMPYDELNQFGVASLKQIIK